MLRKLFILLLSVIVFAACNTSKAPMTFVDKVEVAHQKTKFLEQEAVQFDIKLRFGGKERFSGKMTLLTNSGKGKIDLEDGNGSTILFVDDKVYCSPLVDNMRGKRFTAYTWSYFFLFPYKLSDHGTKWSSYENKTLNDKMYDVEKLSFESGIGDAPDDWYVVYADKQSHLVEVSAYIVTAGKSKEKAEEDPHAIKYEDYQMVDGVPIATKWTFWGWQAEAGLTDQLGDADLTNVAFVDVGEDFFLPPTDFVEVK